MVSKAWRSVLSSSPKAAAAPPSAETVWLRIGYTLETSAMLRPSEICAAAIAALRPAAPPPTMTMSYAIVSKRVPLEIRGLFTGSDGAAPTFCASPVLRRSEPIEHDGPFDLLDGLRHLDAARAGVRAIEGGSAPEYARPVGQDVQALPSALVPRVEDETVGVDDGGRADVLAVAPEDGTGRGAGSAEDALGGVVVSFPLFRGLPTFAVGRVLVVDQIRQHPFVSLKEGVHVYDEVLHDGEASDRFDRDLRGHVPDQDLARQRVSSVDEHRVCAADAVSARPPE